MILNENKWSVNGFFFYSKSKSKIIFFENTKWNYAEYLSRFFFLFFFLLISCLYNIEKNSALHGWGYKLCTHSVESKLNLPYISMHKRLLSFLHRKQSVAKLRTNRFSYNNPSIPVGSFIHRNEVTWCSASRENSHFRQCERVRPTTLWKKKKEKNNVYVRWCIAISAAYGAMHIFRHPMEYFKYIYICVCLYMGP